MKLSELDYKLPQELIAQEPLSQRDASRLLVLSRAGQRWEDRRFIELPELLRGDELLVVNNARVDRKSTRLNSSHIQKSRMPSSA